VSGLRTSGSVRRGLRLAALALSVLAGAAAAGTLAAAPAAAQAITPAPLNQQCLACHGAGQKATVIVNGVRKSLAVDASSYGHSLHGALACTSCHIGFTAGAHTAAQKADWLETAKLNACANCHASEFSMYQGSFHGKLVLNRDSTSAPRCADCHDAHNVVDVTSLAFRKSVLQMCPRCHGGRDATYLDGYHGKAFSLGRTDTAVCTDCHGGHKILPASDSASTVSKGRLLSTCRKCHPSANTNFIGYRIHVDPSNPHSSLAVFFFWTAYIALIAVVFTFGGLHTALYIYRGIKSGGYRRRHV
jgi:hypothetical protein